MITIFIHGTFFSITKIPITYNLFYAPFGFHDVKSMAEKYRIKGTAQLLCALAPQRFDFDHFYTLGWEGHLSDYARKKSSLKLYKILVNLIQEYQKIHNTNPPITLITHSHGGNVALYLAEHAQNHNNLSFCIDTLILLACPIQEQTKNLAIASYFKQIYSLHSHIDLLQIIDPQGINYFVKHCFESIKKSTFTISSKDFFPLFSQRHFPSAPHIIQVNTKINGLGLLHLDFILNSFLKLLPQILDILEQNKIHPYLPTHKSDIILNLESKI